MDRLVDRLGAGGCVILVRRRRWLLHRRRQLPTALNGLAFTLLAFGAHVPGEKAAAAPKGPAEAQALPSQGRAEQVRSFVEAYRKRHGRDPTFSDVRNTLRLPPSTASVYLRKALA